LIVLSAQAIVATTVALAHLSLLGYLLFKRNAQRWLWYAIVGYLTAALAWNLVILLQESPVVGQVSGRPHPFIFLYPLILVALFTWLFTHEFLQSTRSTWGKILFAGVALGLMTTLDFGNYTLPQIPIPFTDRYLDRPTIVFWIAVATITFLLGYAIWLTVYAQKRMHIPRHRNRAQLLQMSLFFIVGGTGLYLSLQPLLQEIGLVIHWLGALILTYIKLNRYLPDLKAGSKELLAWIITTLVTVALYFEVIYIFELYLNNAGYSPITIALSATVVLIILYPILRQITQSLIQRILFKYQYN